MSGDMMAADIIILALVAGFILLRLRNILGQNADPIERMTPQPEEKVRILETVQQPFADPPVEENVDAFLAEDAGKDVPATLAAIRKLDPAFRLSAFLEGAVAAFEMVLEAFAKADRKTLKMLLGPEVFERFMQEIKQRKADERVVETTLVAVRSSEVVDASLKGAVASLTVKFLSEQITMVRDKQGTVVEGDPSLIETVEDVWVFERDAKSNDPNWKLVATQG